MPRRKNQWPEQLSWALGAQLGSGSQQAPDAQADSDAHHQQQRRRQRGRRGRLRPGLRSGAARLQQVDCEPSGSGSGLAVCRVVFTSSCTYDLEATEGFSCRLRAVVVPSSDVAAAPPCLRISAYAAPVQDQEHDKSVTAAAAGVEQGCVEVGCVARSSCKGPSFGIRADQLYLHNVTGAAAGS